MQALLYVSLHSTKKPVTTMITYPWKCIILHCNHLGNTWKPLVLMTRHFDYCLSASEHGDNQSVRSWAPVVSRCFPGGYNVKLYISKGRLAWWLLAFLHSEFARSETLLIIQAWIMTIWQVQLICRWNLYIWVFVWPEQLLSRVALIFVWCIVQCAFTRYSSLWVTMAREQNGYCQNTLSLLHL